MKRMTRSISTLMALFISAQILTACGVAGSGGTTPVTTKPTTTTGSSTAPSTTAPAGKLTFKYDFSKGDHGWTTGYSDYSTGMESGIEFESGIAPLPDELKPLGQAYHISTRNISDDVFMFLKKQLGKADGIVPNRTYKANIEISFATNAFSGSVGIGGSPAESVFVKVGGAPLEPKAESSNDYVGLNLDKGAQNGGGRYAVQIGNVAKTDGSEDNRYAIKTLSNESQALTITSDANGELWIFVGTDSGFEGTTTLYYTSIDITLSE